MMFCFRGILQIWIILIGFRDMNDLVNRSICKHEFKFTFRGYFRFTLKPTLKLISNSSILIKVSNWDLKRALDRLK